MAHGWAGWYVSDGVTPLCVTLTKPSDTVAEADLNRTNGNRTI